MLNKVDLSTVAAIAIEEIKFMILASICNPSLELDYVVFIKYRSDSILAALHLKSILQLKSKVCI